MRYIEIEPPPGNGADATTIELVVRAVAQILSDLEAKAAHHGDFKKALRKARKRIASMANWPIGKIITLASRS